MRYLLLAVAIFCLVHIVRDIMQIKGIKNWFTQWGHFWHAPKYEIHGIVILGIVAAICLYFFFKI